MPLLARVPTETQPSTGVSALSMYSLPEPAVLVALVEPNEKRVPLRCASRPGEIVPLGHVTPSPSSVSERSAFVGWLDEKRNEALLPVVSAAVLQAPAPPSRPAAHRSNAVPAGAERTPMLMFVVPE